MIADSLFDLAASLLPTCASANVLQPYLSVSPQLSAVMYPSGGGRPLRSGYGFPGDSAAGSYPLVGGMHPGGVFGGNPQPLKQREISFDTSSKEPHLIRARVFVGNMNTNAITREDIIRLFSAYGTLLGVTLFKGYAFIQYGNASEADLAVSVLNGYNWNGSILEGIHARQKQSRFALRSLLSCEGGLKYSSTRTSWSLTECLSFRIAQFISKMQHKSA